MSKSRAGVTLLELVVAIALAGATVVIARTAWVALGEQRARAIEQEMAELNARNGRAWLRQLVGSMQSPTESASFIGSPRGARFVAWAPTSDGWSEAAAVELMVRDAGGLEVRVGGAVRMRLREVGEDARFDFLLASADRPLWVGEWASASTLPVAIRLRWRPRGSGGADTLLLLPGPRG